MFILLVTTGLILLTISLNVKYFSICSSSSFLLISLSTELFDASLGNSTCHKVDNFSEVVRFYLRLEVFKC